jgi:hypothetical protein
MERVVVLSVDEASVLIGLLDVKHSPGASVPLAEMAERYQQLLSDRITDVPDADALPTRVAAAQRENTLLRSRRDELLAACRAALQFVGTEGRLEGRPPNDPDLGDVRSLLATVAAA